MVPMRIMILNPTIIKLETPNSVRIVTQHYPSISEKISLPAPQGWLEGGKIIYVENNFMKPI